jgi:hypothetical protein
VPAIFLYCEEDAVINCQNTHLICSKYRAVFEKLAIEENHNTIRTQGTLDKIFSFIDKYSKKPKQKIAKDIESFYFDSKPLPSKIESTPKRKMHSRCDKSFD